MVFNREVFDLMPPKNVSFPLIGTTLPSNKDIFFRSKQEETLERYQAARRFMYEIETTDWDHYFVKPEDPKAGLYFQLIYTAQLYEAALAFYNSVVDLSWTCCYVSVEYLIYLDGQAVSTEGLTPIETAYQALRKAEQSVQHPGAEDSPFDYLRKMCPESSAPIETIISFWEKFSASPIRYNYNYSKHKGCLHYEEVEKLKPARLLKLKVDEMDCPSDVRDVQKVICLTDAIESLRQFDNEELFPYVETLFSQLEKVVKPSPFIF